jgi:hypothetical protein
MPRVNWSQAAGEAVLILSGVLVALAADAWWEERSERRQEREYLEALSSELAQMKSHVEGVVRQATEIEDSGERLLGISSSWGTRPVSPDSLTSLIVDVSNEGDWSPPNTVYQDLVNTGAVKIIRSEEVRRGLNELMASLNWVKSRQDRHNEFFWSQMEPYFREQLPVVEVWGYERLRVSSEPWTPDTFVGTRKFRNLVAAKAMMAVDVRVGAEDLIDLIDRLGETIDAQAGGI